MHARLFDDIAWSTPQVFTQTVERAHEIGLEPVVLPVWYDVDDIESLRRLHRELRDERVPGSYPAPHTAAFLRGLFGDGMTGSSWGMGP
jgi:hypothetical protein